MTSIVQRFLLDAQTLHILAMKFINVSVAFYCPKAARLLNTMDRYEPQCTTMNHNELYLGDKYILFKRYKI